MASTRTLVLEEHPRANSMSSMDMREMRSSHFLGRTSMFLKKVTLFRSGRRKSEERRAPAAMMPRSARSMDVGMGNKAFGMSQPILSVNTEQSMTDNEDHSDASGSPLQPSRRLNSSLPPHPQSALPVTPVHQQNVNDAHAPRPGGLPPVELGPPKIVIDGLPVSIESIHAAASSSGKQPTKPDDNGNVGVTSSSSVGSGLSDSASTESFHSAPENICSVTGEPIPGPSATIPSMTAAAAVDAPKTPHMKFKPATPLPRHVLIDTTSPQFRSQSLPSRNFISPNATPAITHVAHSPSTSTATPAIPEQETPTSLHLRLASLPPPMMARYATQGSARLTPSIVQRPMPILNLPTLPPPTPPLPPTAAQMSSPMRLRSIPALPMRGPSEIDIVHADHDNAALDEMDEMMEEEEEEEGPAEQEHASDDEESSPGVEVPGMGRRLRSPLPPSLSRSPRVPADLPPVDVSPLEINFGTPTPHAAAASGAEAQRATMYFTPTDPVPPTDILVTPIPAFRKAGATPNVQVTDYFTSKSPEGTPRHDVSRTPRPGDYQDLPVPRTVPMPHASPRPGLYNQASRSMIDLLSTSRKDKQKEIDISMPERRQSRAPDYMTANSRDTPEAAAGPSASASVKGSPLTLRRQRSLPMFNPASEPPPYPSFALHKPPTVSPRDEEGMEKLPLYTNSIYLAAIMPRKLEFTAPGFQSRDRKWKRALCILDGTVLKVYRIHSGVVEDWWERTVGVGDKTSIDPLAMGPSGGIRVNGVRESERQQDPSKGGSPQVESASAPSNISEPSSSSSPTPCAPLPPSRSKLHNLLHPRSHRLDKNDCNMHSRISLDTSSSSRDEMRTSISTTPRRQSMDSARSTTSPATSSSGLSSSRLGSRRSSDGTSVSSGTRTPSGPSQSTSPPPAVSHFSMLSSSDHMPVQEPDSKDLLRKYSLQNAESGLASDYLKRKNVIRVRMEGEQFLLQARDVPAVIEWIEGIQAATNISLDLDERPMPKGPMFPRRRRRRARRPETTTTQAQDGGSSTTPRPNQNN